MTQPDLPMHIPATRRRRTRRPRRADLPGVRFVWHHPAVGRDTVLCRTVTGLRRRLADFRARVIADGGHPGHISIHLHRDDGTIIRPATVDDLRGLLTRHRS